MKKLNLIIALFLIVQTQVSSQILKGFGLYGALTDSRHKYKNIDAGSRQFTSADFAANPNFYTNTNYIGADAQSWGLGIFAEFSRQDAARWQTELSYTKKASRERPLVDPFNVQRGGFVMNQFTYIQWNNYLKHFTDFGYSGQWYWMLGARIEYLLSGAAAANAPYSMPKKIWASGDLGLGVEFPLIRKINWFLEGHWNQDIYNPKIGSTLMRNRTFELRIGLVYRPRRKSIDDCNAPKYRGPAY